MRGSPLFSVCPMKIQWRISHEVVPVECADKTDVVVSANLQREKEREGERARERERGGGRELSIF